MGIPQAPWTEVGSLQQDICSLRNQMRNKVDDYKITEVSRRLDSLERSLRELSTNVDRLLARLERAEGIITEGDPNA